MVTFLLRGFLWRSAHPRDSSIYRTATNANLIRRTSFAALFIPALKGEALRAIRVTAIFYLLSLGLVLGIIGLAVNARRHRRRDDYYRIHLVLLTALSASGVLYYLVF